MTTIWIITRNKNSQATVYEKTTKTPNTMRVYPLFRRQNTVFKGVIAVCSTRVGTWYTNILFCVTNSSHQIFAFKVEIL